MTKDYQLMKSIKDGVDVKRNKVALYKKYLPLIRKFAFQFGIRMKTKMYYEDYIQEAYFQFEKTVKWVNLQEVENAPENFYFYAPFSYGLRALSIRLKKKYHKMVDFGTHRVVDGKPEFIHHKVESLQNDDGTQLDLIEEVDVLNYNDPIQSEMNYKKVYDVLYDYVYNHEEVLKNPLKIQDDNSSKVFTEKPLKEWQLKYLELLLNGESIGTIAEMRDILPAKQEWYRTRKKFKRFIVERVNRAVNFNLA